MEPFDPAMLLEQLSLKEKLLLARRAELLCVERFCVLAELVQAVDADLSAELEKLAGDEKGHVAAIAKLDEDTEWPTVWHIDEPMVTKLLTAMVPAVTNPLHCEPELPSIKEVVRGIEADSVCMYERMALTATDESSRSFFMRMAELEASHASHLIDN